MNKIVALVPDLVVLEEIMPVAYYFNTKVVIVDLNGVMNMSHYSSEIKNGVSIIRIEYNISVIIKCIMFVNKVFQKLRIPIKYFADKIYQYRMENYSNNYFQTMNLHMKSSEISFLLVPPRNDLLLREIVRDYRKQNYPGSIIGISQAMPVLTNILQDKEEYKIPPAGQFFSVSIGKLCDRVLYNSNITMKTYKKLIFQDMKIDFLDRFTYIDSIRNTVEWQSVVREDWIKHHRNVNYEGSTDKIKVLFLHSNFYANIHEAEVRRAIRILDSYDCFHLGIRPHIRLGKMVNASEVNYLFKGVDSYIVFFDSLIESILWSDVVVFYGSSAVIDALIFQKHTIFLRFATSNKLDDNLSRNVLLCHTPDDFIFECNDLVNKSEKKLPLLTLPKLGTVLNEWSKQLEIKY